MRKRETAPPCGHACVAAVMGEEVDVNEEDLVRC